MTHARSWIVALLLSLCAAPLAAQDDGPPRGRDEAKKPEKIKPYDKVITKEAKTQSGLFLVHQVDDAVFYEIPRASLGKDFLWVMQIAKTGAGHGYGGTPAGNRVVRWELRDETVLLRDVKYRVRANGEGPVAQAVESTTVAPIIRSFPVKAWGKDLAPVIDVSEVFTGEVAEFSAKDRLGASGADRKRTFVEKIKVFPGNIESKVLVTYNLAGGGGREGGGRTPPSPVERFGRRGEGGAVTVLLHHSMVALPEDPMPPRVKDDRVGFFDVGFEDYGTDEHQVKQVRYVTRWRLEKKDEKAEVSEPKKPIVFYVGREVPEKWRPWIRKGIEAWQPAFEAAGFKNAILAKDPPSEREDPDWDAEDARYSVIRWLPSTIENAMGPHIHDPRTGEILEADIIVYHNILKLIRDWYFVQASPMDERAQQLPMPDDLIGELLAYVISHEVGHSLGFPHNMKASSSFTVAQLRDPAFTARNGTEASIMDYGRYNYVCQPGDGARLIPVIGPYDFFAVEWGYRSFPAAKDAAAEKQALEAIVTRQVTDPMLRFGDANPGEDPSAQTEDLGSDAIEATRLGLLNIDRVAGYLVKATCKPGEDYALLRNMYEELIGQWRRELMHVANVVGGINQENLWYGDADRVFNPLARERQKEAVAFLIQNAFETPRTLIATDIVQRLEATGAADRLLAGQRPILASLLGERRVKRMAETAERFPEDAYRPIELMEDVRTGVWRELHEERVEVDLFRRNLQRAHVEILSKALEAESAASDLPALCRGELKTLQGLIRGAFNRVADELTRLHLDDMETRVDRALDPRAPKPPEAAPVGAGLIPQEN